MKNLTLPVVFLVLLSCSNHKSENAIAEKDSVTTDAIPKHEAAAMDSIVIPMSSVYDDAAHDITDHRADLKMLSDSAVFSTLHDSMFVKLPLVHKTYFSSHPNYKLLFQASGDLFQQDREDFAFIVYDQKNVQISIVLFNATTNVYGELYRDVKVFNALDADDCTYGAFGSLDYQLAYEFFEYRKNDLIRQPAQAVESPLCKIVDIHTDTDFILDSGCFARNLVVSKGMKSLCIPTSSVYANWECLSYNKASDMFIVFYGQAFAD